MQKLIAELQEWVRKRTPRTGLNYTETPELVAFRQEGATSMAKSASGCIYIGIILSGRKQVVIGERKYVYDVNNYFVLTSSARFESCVVDASSDEPYLSIGIAPPPDLVAEILLELGEGTGAQDYEAEPAFLDQMRPEILESVARLARTLDDEHERRVLMPLMLRELVFRLFRTDAAAVLRSAVVKNGDEARIKDAMDFIKANASQPLTVEQIARQVSMSPSHFAHRFSEVARVSPIRYMKLVRLQRARLLMVNEGLRPMEAAVEVGYASPSHFTRDFKTWFGMPPGEFSSRMRSEAAAG